VFSLFCVRSNLSDRTLLQMKLLLNKKSTAYNTLTLKVIFGNIQTQEGISIRKYPLNQHYFQHNLRTYWTTFPTSWNIPKDFPYTCTNFNAASNIFQRNPGTYWNSFPTLAWIWNLCLLFFNTISEHAEKFFLHWKLRVLFFNTIPKHTETFFLRWCKFKSGFSAKIRFSHL
jgi:hypothetical protein